MENEDIRVFKEIINFFLSLLLSVWLNADSSSSIFGIKT